MCDHFDETSIADHIVFLYKGKVWKVFSINGEDVNIVHGKFWLLTNSTK
jgi:hypothetical protein